MLLSDGWLEEFQQCIIRKHNGHTLRWRYDYSHTPRPCRHLVTASLCFRGLFFWDALYTRNRDSERSMINATILERRFERRLQTRFDYGYWNVILLMEKVINAPKVVSAFCSRSIKYTNVIGVSWHIGVGVSWTVVPSHNINVSWIFLTQFI